MWGSFQAGRDPARESARKSVSAPAIINRKASLNEPLLENTNGLGAFFLRSERERTLGALGRLHELSSHYCSYSLMIAISTICLSCYLLYQVSTCDDIVHIVVDHSDNFSVVPFSKFIIPESSRLIPALEYIVAMPAVFGIINFLAAHIRRTTFFWDFVRNRRDSIAVHDRTWAWLKREPFEQDKYEMGRYEPFDRHVAVVKSVPDYKSKHYVVLIKGKEHRVPKVKPIKHTLCERDCCDRSSKQSLWSGHHAESCCHACATFEDMPLLIELGNLCQDNRHESREDSEDCEERYDLSDDVVAQFHEFESVVSPMPEMQSDLHFPPAPDIRFKLHELTDEIIPFTFDQLVEKARNCYPPGQKVSIFDFDDELDKLQLTERESPFGKTRFVQLMNAKWTETIQHDSSCKRVEAPCKDCDRPANSQLNSAHCCKSCYLTYGKAHDFFCSKAYKGRPIYIDRLAILPIIMCAIWILRAACLIALVDPVGRHIGFCLKSLGVLIGLGAYYMLLDSVEQRISDLKRRQYKMTGKSTPSEKNQAILYEVVRMRDPVKDGICNFGRVNTVPAEVLQYAWWPYYIGGKILGIVFALSVLLDFTINALAIMAMLSGVAFFLDLQNNISLLMKLSLTTPFFVGDLITLNSVGGQGMPQNSVMGFVENITLNYIVVRNFEMKQTWISHRQFSTMIIQNWSRRPTKTVLLNFGISLECSRDKVEKLALFGKTWISESPDIQNGGDRPFKYSKCHITGTRNGYNIEVIFFPDYRVSHREIRQKFILAFMGAAERLSIRFVPQTPMKQFGEIEKEVETLTKTFSGSVRQKERLPTHLQELLPTGDSPLKRKDE